MKRLIVIGVIAVCASACGGDGAASTTVPSVVTTTVAESSPATTTTTSTTSTTTPPTTTTTLPETTTTVPTEDLIKQAVQDYFIAYELCGQSPSACLPDTFTAGTGRSRPTVTELATGMARQGLYFSADLNGSYVVAESIVVNSPTLAAVTACWYDAGTVLGPIGPDGNPTLVNNQIVSYRYKFMVYWEGDRWRVGEQLDVEHLGEGNQCPASS